ncbi:hypothetical protein [Halpernia sp. GG3]
MKQYLLFTMIILFSCNANYKQYQHLNKNALHNKLYSEQLKLVKALLSKEKEPVILIISWKQDILSDESNIYYESLIYNPQNKKIKILKTTKNNQNYIVVTTDLATQNFKELTYILDNYLNGYEEHLLSLHDSFSNSEMNSPFYIYDFVKNKKIKLKSFFFDKNGIIIQ